LQAPCQARWILKSLITRIFLYRRGEIGTTMVLRFDHFAPIWRNPCRSGFSRDPCWPRLCENPTADGKISTPFEWCSV
jgi:hypothetical protein